jgi:hypothetical protein
MQRQDIETEPFAPVIQAIRLEVALAGSVLRVQAITSNAVVQALLFNVTDLYFAPHLVHGYPNEPE